MPFWNITRWPGALVFVLGGLAAVVFAFVSVNLVSHGMANRDFIREHGWLAIQNGALLQIVELTLYGSIALLCWLIFKICEQELSARYFAWARARQTAPRTRKS